MSTIKKTITVMAMVLFSLVLNPTYSYTENLLETLSKEDINKLYKVEYGFFTKIKSFSIIKVYIQGDAEKIGLSEDELTDYLRLRIKNSFIGIKRNSEFVSEILNKGREHLSTLGTLYINVWTVGEDYPIAYHIEIRGGYLGASNLYTDSALGFGSKNNVPKTVKRVISGLVDKMAIIFFKVRDEL